MKFLFDIFPVILFFVAFKLYDIYVATAVAIAATVVQIAWVWLRHRKVDKMLWVSFGVIAVFGGIGLMLLFIVLQAIMLARYAEQKKMD